VQALYQWDITKQDADSIRRSFIFDDRLTGRYLEYFAKMLKGITSNIEEIDTLIDTHLDRPIIKIDPLEKAILRVGAYELVYELDVPPNVVLNEGIEISKLFCSEQGYKYVNAVLDSIVKARAKA
jgi:N utilization substance protein B